MGTTLGTLRSKLTIRMKIDRVGRIWGDDEKNEAINTAILQIQRDGDFNWSENNLETTLTTVSAQQEYDLPATFQQVDVVKVGNILQTSINRDELLRSNRADTTGTPLAYYIRGLKVGLSPIPVTAGENILVAYREILPELSSDTDALSFPTTFNEAVYAYAAYILFSEISDTKNTNRASGRLRRYNDEMNQLRGTYLFPDKAQLQYRTTYRSGIRGRNANRIIVID